MENEDTQTEKKIDKPSLETIDHGQKTKKPNTTIPLMITIIGIFCYLGVILPSVFKTSTRFFNFSAFDILLMIGGAALVGLGMYLWFTVRADVFREEEKKSIELA
jgi:hypothetical protein